jgi:transposase-like protein
LQISDGIPHETEVVTAAPKADPAVAVPAENMAVDVAGNNTSTIRSVPEILHPGRLDEYREAYLQEERPVGPTEHALVREMAHHSATMDLLNEAISAIQRQGARDLPEFAQFTGEIGSALYDTVLTGAMTQEAVDRCEKQLRSHSRGFHRALAKLEELQARRQEAEAGEMEIPPNPFTIEAACETYLAERFKTGKCLCPRCGSGNGRHITSHRCWECADCGCQTGLRHGTVMADSPLPLATWFTAIWLLLWRPTITTAELVSALGINRIMTARSLTAKIRAAMAAENAGALLAGLDGYAVSRAESPESGALPKRNASSSSTSAS